MAPHFAGFVVAYVVGSGVMMYANTAWFGLGEPKLVGWSFYWLLWALAYAPIALAALAAALGAMETSNVLDVNWQTILVEWVILAIVFLVCGMTCRMALTDRST